MHFQSHSTQFRLDDEDMDSLLEKILLYFVSNEFKEEVQKARVFFFAGLSFGDENAHSYDARMAQFFDWYLFTRELSEYKQVPLKVVATMRGLRFTGKELEILSRLRVAKHSLFDFVKCKGHHIHIRDLLTKKKHIIYSEKRSYIFQEGEIFEARLIPLSPQESIFTRGLCLHPPRARKYILKEIKQLLKNPDLSFTALALRLNKMRYKLEQYPHVSMDHIYTNGSIL